MDLPSDKFILYESLPVELVIHILNFTDSTSLARLSRSCKKYRAIAEQFLYSDVSSHPEDGRSLSAARAVGFLRALLNPVFVDAGHPARRTRYLRRFCVSLRDWARPQFLFLRGLLRLVADTLANCPNIIELHILDFQHRDAWVLNHCISRPKIFATTLPPSPTLEGFLFNKSAPQTNLETLVLANRFSAYWNSNFSLPNPLPVGETWALPSLRMVFGRADVLHFVVPSRPVDRAVYDFSLDAYDDPSTAYPRLREALARSAKPVKRLGIQVRAGPRDNVIWGDCPLFSDVRGSPLESVAVLDLYIPTFYYFKAFDEIRRFLSPFPSLEKFNIYSGHVFKVYSDLDLLRAASSWRQSCKHLRLVDFHQFESWSLKNDTPARTLRCTLSVENEQWTLSEVAPNSIDGGVADQDYLRLAELLRLTLRG